ARPPTSSYAAQSLKSLCPSCCRPTLGGSGGVPRTSALPAEGFAITIHIDPDGRGHSPGRDVRVIARQKWAHGFRPAHHHDERVALFEVEREGRVRLECS